MNIIDVVRVAETLEWPRCDGEGAGAAERDKPRFLPSFPDTLWGEGKKAR